MLRRLSTLCALVAFAVLAARTAAGPGVPHKEKCAGELTSFTPTTMSFTGVGTATHMGRYEIEGEHDYFPDGTLVGEFTSTAADGSTVSGIYFGTYAPAGGTNVRFDVEVHYLSGTGRLAGVSGVADTVAFLDLATGKCYYDTLGTWNLP